MKTIIALLLISIPAAAQELRIRGDSRERMPAECVICDSSLEDYRFTKNELLRSCAESAELLMARGEGISFQIVDNALKAEYPDIPVHVFDLSSPQDPQCHRVLRPALDWLFHKKMNECLTKFAGPNCRRYYPVE
jgi:hypothetical protein